MEQTEFRHIVRIGGSDLPGTKSVLFALRKVKGIGFIMGNAICHLSQIDRTKRAGDLSDTEIRKLNSTIENLKNESLPKWLVNRRKDPETGVDKHLMGPDLMLAKEDDIKTLRKIKSYKGFRHGKGLPVRGQKTKSNFRRNKGKSLGVKRKR